MSDYTDLDAYNFFQEQWDSYDDLYNAFEWEVPDSFNVATYLCDRWAANEPDRTAVYIEQSDGPRAYSFEKVRDWANQLANFLEDHGVTYGDRIGVSGAQRIETVVATFATWKLGAVVVPINTLTGTDGMRYRLRDSATKAFVCDESSIDVFRTVRDDLPDLELGVGAGDVTVEENEWEFWDAIESHGDTFQTYPTQAEDSAQMIYTSGTTGDPKGVLHAHHHVLGILPGYAMTHRNLEMRQDDVVRITADWSWSASLNDVMYPGFYFGTPIVGARSGEFDPEREFELIDTFDVSVFSTASTTYRMMSQVERPSERFDLDSIRVIVMGGEAVGHSLIQWARDTFDDPAIHVAYGQTESPLCMTCCENLGVEIKPGDNYLGKPVPGYDIRLVDPETKEPTVSQGEVGEIAINATGNPSCLTEYWNKPEKTEKKFRDGWMLTEDLASVDEDGYYVFHSRIDDVIISSGYRLSPEEIEEAVVTHETVTDVGVVGVDHEQRGEIPKAFVKLADDVEKSQELREDLQSYVKDRLAKYEYPREIEFVEELPKTDTGKVKRSALAE
jgi:acetyl-CoA synthetase